MAKNKKSTTARFVWLAILGVVSFCAIIAFLLRGTDVILLNPKGVIAHEQYRLLIHSTLIMLIIGVPTLFVLYFFAWRYRDTNKGAAYNPNPTSRRFTPALLWAMPGSIVVILAIIMLPATQKLEPRRSIESDKEAITIQVVAMRWKWLFIYPDHDIATVNFAQIPVDTPVKFKLTADNTPKSSFWIPHLGGMLYAMTEHVNELNLMADTIGDFEGSPAEINGHGFAGMRFTTRVSSQEDFDAWTAKVATESTALTLEKYGELSEPTEYNEATFYSRPQPGLYSIILSKYAGNHSHSSGYEAHKEQPAH